MKIETNWEGETMTRITCKDVAINEQRLEKRFDLQPSDGKLCAQVLVYNEDDLQHWQKQADEKGYLIAFDYHVSKNEMGYADPEHDVYQLFPPEQKNRIRLRGQRVTAAQIFGGGV